MPSEAVARVCQAGDEFELTCSTNETYLKWSFMARNRLGRFQEYGPRFIYSEDASQQTADIAVNSTIFTITRTSAQNSSPLISTLVINSVNRSLNGTVMKCEDVETTMPATTTIQFIDESMSYLLI